MTVKFRLLLSLSLLAASLLATGLIGLYALNASSDRTRTIVEDRVMPLEQLQAVANAYAVDIVDTAHKVRSGAASWDAGLASVTAALKAVDEHWTAYAATSMTEEEAALAADVKAAMSAANQKVSELTAVLNGRDQAQLEQFVARDLYPTIDPIGVPIGELIELQTRVAQDEYAVALQTNSRSTMFMLVIGVVAAGVVALASWTVVRGVVGPIEEMQGAMRALAEGDVSTTVPHLKRRDEIGGMAAAVQVFKDNAIERAALEAAQRAEQDAKERRAKAVDQLIADFDAGVSAILKTVAQASTKLEGTAANLNGVAERSALNATTVAAASEQATANVQTVASASEELATSIDEISTQVQTSLSVTQRAIEAAELTDQTVQGLVSTAERIGSVVSLISAIAEQTNLLALNATIEAARAGDAGRGFAVVASEVKNLAGQTSKATDEIARQVQEIQGVTGKAAEAIRGIGATIREIDSTSTAIASAVEEQGAATREIARNVVQAAEGTQQVSGSIGGVTEGATQTGVGAAEVLSSAGELARQSVALKDQVERFFSAIRAA
ncbi:methyl-accepting chemotaxis protein [Chthonobacter albigriseus]|uniref:methyl-accepting chemotaxis protein n=1 Tax=Chthonobacter albigriseus TaxID=1683161 RepID=UPI0015EF8DE0|nr:methyl-accepting chemotaxis protein [Chthonobacter albigriseus]